MKSSAVSLLLLVIAGVLPAQDQQPERTTSWTLSQPWRFHTGDNPQWKDPAFDDSAWGSILPSKYWTDQGIVTDPSGYGWYRLRVTIESDEPLFLHFPRLRSAAEVFVNGHKILQYGVPGDVWRSAVFIAPAAALPPMKRGDVALIAVRAWLCYDDDRSHLGGGMSIAPQLGPRFPIEGAARLQSCENQKTYLANLLTGALGIFLALLLLFCWRRQPTHTEYAWYAGMLLGRAMNDLFWYALFAIGIMRGFGCFIGVAFAINLGCSYFFFRSYFRTRPSRWFGWVLGACLLMQLADAGGWVDWYSGSISTSLLLAGHVPVLLANALLLIREGRQGNREAWTLAFPYVIYAGGIVARFIQQVSVFVGVFPHSDFLNNGFLLLAEPLNVSIENAAMILGSLAITGILLNRFTRTALEGERLAGEFEAARQVQELLLPAENQSVPGFAVETVYLPASEVGGDFYQILPGSDGSVLVVVGDVSGKGLKAAMIVSATVGAIGMATVREPAELLSELNRALAGRVAGGFVTCCAVLISADGSLRAASAGHPAAYAEGRELEVPNGLPLGITADSTYASGTFDLAPGATLMLLSDGVLEAENIERELFGFDRTREISGRSAGEIAAAAQAWGQNDDITVVTVRRAT